MNSLDRLKTHTIAQFGVALAATALLATGVSAHDGDHWPIGGDQLKIRSSGSAVQKKFQFKAKKQVNINATSLQGDPTVERSTLLVRGSGAAAGTSGIIELDPAKWQRIGSESNPKGWQYKGSYFDVGGVSKIQIKTGNTTGSLQIQAKGANWPFEVLGPQDSVEVVLSIGDFAFCSEFSADREAEFKTNETGEISAIRTNPPSECPLVCGNGLVEIGEECDDGNFFDGDTCNNLCEGCNPSSAVYASTFEGIQDLIFDSPVYSCSNDTCHGSALAGGLDLRAGASHAALVGIASSIDPGTQRVFAGDQDLSMLYLKIAEKTLNNVNPPGSAMPVNSSVVTEEHLAALRLWIRGGAPETGVVAGSAELLGSCLPAATPLDIPQPPIPDPSAGSQFAMPGYTLTTQTETEGCVASYYDVSATVPPGMIVNCPGAFPGTNETGLNAGKCFSYQGNALFQDAQSHHSIIHIYKGTYGYNDPGWGTWRCYDGPTPDQACDPNTSNPCGTGGTCGSRFHAGVACLPTPSASWGAPDFTTAGGNAPTFAGSQESTSDQNYPTGVYGVLPLKGLIVWNSHAFNLTGTSTEMNAWLNMGYTDQRNWPAQALFNDQYIFTQNVPPFQQREYCATHTFDENTHLFQLSSHTHKRGIRWRYYAAPQAPCIAGGSTTNPSCTPSGTMFYESFDYSDALTINYPAPLTFNGSVNDRTIKFCALFDNGQDEPTDVKTQSGSPVPTGNLIVGGPCADSATYCNGGANKGQACNGNDANCPGSVCDACTLRGGVTTEDEMFIALGNYYVP